jgi:hypothetical protein
MFSRSFWLVASFVSLPAFFSSACGEKSSPASPAAINGPSAFSSLATAGSPDASQFSGPVGLRVAHLSTDAPPVDIWVNGSVVLAGVPFGVVSDYLGLEAGEYRIQVTPAGATSPIVIDATLDLQAGRVYTVAAVGFLSSGSLEPLVLLDDLSTGQGARIRFVHTSADTGAVDVALKDGPVLFGDVTFQESGGYIEVPGGAYDLEVRPSGSLEVALSIPGVEVLGGTTYTIFAIGRSFNGTLAPLPVVDAP